MISTKLLAIPLALIILLMGWLGPHLLLLDMPFGLAFYITDKFGRWEPGLLWAPNNRVLAIVCVVVWPLLVSWIIAYGLAWITLRLWRGQTLKSYLYAVLFLVLAFGLILSVRIQPGSLVISYFGYTTANY